MSGLDINALRLTQEEREQLPGRDTYFAGHKWPYARVEAAQLAKAAWGIADWLTEGPGAERRRQSVLLFRALDEANIERPTAAQDTAR